MRTRDIGTAFFLFAFLLGVYALAYNGVPATDDEQLFASSAMNLAEHGDFNTGQLFGNTRLRGSYTGVEPLHPVLASLWYRLFLHAESFGSLQALYLLPMLYTALAANLVLLIARLWGYPLRTGAIAGLLFGTCTIAFPYARMFFRETLAMFLLALAFYCFELAAQPKRPTSARLLAFYIWILALVGMLLTKVALVVALPAFVALAWTRRGELIKGIRPGEWTVAMTGLAGAAVGLYWLAGDVLPAAFFNRLSGEFFTLVAERLLSISHDGFFNAFLGSLFSPGKGLFIYSPALILAVISLFLKAPYADGEGDPRWRWKIFPLPWSTLLGLLVVQALVYDREWWNVTWGTRYLLPTLPLLVIGGLPALDHVLGSSRRDWRRFLGAAAGLSILVQLGGVLVADPTYLASLYAQSPAPVPALVAWDLRYAPLVGHWRLLLSGAQPALAWVRTFPAAPTNVTVTLALSLLLVTIPGRVLLRIVRGDDPATQVSARISLAAAALLLILLPPVLLGAYRHDPAYYTGRGDYRAAYAHLEESLQPGDVVVLRSYLLPAWYYWMNTYRLPAPWYALPLPEDLSDEADVEPLDDQGIVLFESLSERYDRVWLVVDRLPRDASIPVCAEEVFLQARFTPLDARSFSAQDGLGMLRMGLYWFE